MENAQQPGFSHANGFLLDYNRAGDLVVLLLQKKHGPPHMIGQWTAPGGKTEAVDRRPEETASREVQEETGLVIPPANWTAFGEIRRKESRIALLTAWYDVDGRTHPDPFRGARARTAEPLRIWRVADLLSELPPTSNVPLLVHAAHYALARRKDAGPPAMLTLSIEER